MFFDSASEISAIASRTGAAVFVVPDGISVNLPGAIIVQPEEKASITIDQIRRMMRQVELRQTKDIYVVIRPADKMNLEAANAFLKSLEEPGEKVHFVLITSKPSMLLPTVLSRTFLYILSVNEDSLADTDKVIRDLAKKLIVARGAELVAVAEEIAKKKGGVREYALSVVGTGIGMLQKSYFLTRKEALLVRLTRFIDVYEALSRNGHVKLQIVAGLM